MDADLDTLATALYVTIDETLQASPELAPWRPAVGIAPKLTAAELLTLAVLQALLGHVSEARWLRYARKHLRGLVPYLPGQSGYSKRLKAAVPQLRYFIRALAVDTGLWTQTLWVADSTPVECGRSRETVKRSALAGWAGYGYCASHSRWFWGLRLHLVTTLDGLPIAYALTNPTADEREVLGDLLQIEPGLLEGRPEVIILVDKGDRDAATEARLAEQGGAAAAASLPGRGIPARPGAAAAAAATHRVDQRHPQGQLDLERHGGRTSQPVIRSLVAYDSQ